MTKDEYATDNVTSLGDEGEFALKFDVADVDAVLSLLVRAIQEAGYEDQMYIGTDPAASEFYAN